MFDKPLIVADEDAAKKKPALLKDPDSTQMLCERGRLCSRNQKFFFWGKIFAVGYPEPAFIKTWLWVAQPPPAVRKEVFSNREDERVNQEAFFPMKKNTLNPRMTTQLV